MIRWKCQAGCAGELKWGGMSWQVPEEKGQRVWDAEFPRSPEPVLKAEILPVLERQPVSLTFLYCNIKTSASHNLKNLKGQNRFWEKPVSLLLLIPWCPFQTASISRLDGASRGWSQHLKASMYIFILFSQMIACCVCSFGPCFLKVFFFFFFSF
jgi:hypothetical protein